MMKVYVSVKGERVVAVCDNKRHLVCLPYSIEGLHAIAKELDIKRHWFHKDHYDIPKTRIEEITKQCVVVGSREIVNIKNKRNVYETLVKIVNNDIREAIGDELSGWNIKNKENIKRDIAARLKKYVTVVHITTVVRTITD